VAERLQDAKGPCLKLGNTLKQKQNELI